MSTYDLAPTPPGNRPGPGDRLADVAVGAAPVVLAGAALGWGLALPGEFVAWTLGVYAALGLLVLGAVPRHLPGPGLGAANRVTLGRSTLVVPVAALALGPWSLGSGSWWPLALAGAALALDGVDGWVARRSGGCTEFGSRFDMELDALLIFSLSVLVWRSGAAGPWVLMIGGLRYLFVGAGWIWPFLRGELPPSFRRKTVCVVQVVALLLCLAPLTPVAWVPAVAGAALLSLIGSFGVDVLWLARPPHDSVG